MNHNITYFAMSMKENTLRSESNEYRVKFRFLILTFMLVVFYTTLLFSATVYIDPGYTGSVKNGTQANPYSSWNQVSFANGNTYLQKRGTVYTTPGNIWVYQKSHITIGAYGTGPKPAIVSTGTGVKVVDFGNSQNCTLTNVEIYSTGNATAGVYFANGCANNLIDSVVVHDCEWGVRITSTGVGNRILNSEIHHTGDDGVYIKDVPNIEIAYCTIHSVNTKWFVNTDESYSSGDCIQISSTNNLNFNIHHNTLDHSLTGNKFCFIAYGVNYTGVIEHNTLIGNAAGNNSCIYFHATTGTVTVRYNTLRNANYAIYSYVDNLLLQYNSISNNTAGIRVLTNHNLTAFNNVFYSNNTYAISSLGGTTVTSKNNIFYLTSSSSKAYSTGATLISDYNDFSPEQAGFINGYNTLQAWRNATGSDMHSLSANPQFVNPAAGDFCLQPGSPCINAGTNVNLSADFFGTTVPQGNMPDIGIYEAGSSSSNQSPVIINQSFNINENMPNGTLVGQVIASDPNAGQTLSFAITSGNTSGAFYINSSNGNLTVANSSALNYETNPVFQLTVQVTDNGPGNLSASATITVNVNNINEPPVMAAQSFSISTGLAQGSPVGNMSATDPDAGQTLTYSITAGNTGNAFAINASSGLITVANAGAVVQGIFSLSIRATDNGTPVLYTQATATISVSASPNQAPVISNQAFTIQVGLPNGTAIGTVIATDPNQGQTLTFSIVSGNNAGIFSIGANSGVLTVSNTAQLVAGSYALTVRVTDNGIPSLWSQAVMTITASQNTNHPPVISNQWFQLSENAAYGAAVGTVVAFDPDAGQSITFSLTGGNSANAFSLNAISGLLTVNNPAAINFETYPVFSLLVRATDNGTGNLWSQAIVTINILDVNESPVMNGETFAVKEYAPVGTIVGTAHATDPDQNQTLTYTIVEGNTSDAFAVDPLSGLITVSNPAALNPNFTSSFNLVIRANDNGSPQLSAKAEFIILVKRLRDDEILTSESNTLPTLNLYPNPSPSGLYTLKAHTNNQKGDVYVFNTQGALISTMQVADNTEYKLNLSNQTAGTYLIRISTPLGGSTLKAIKSQ